MIFTKKASRKTFAIAMIAALVLTLFSTLGGSPKTANAAQNYKLVGYYASWARLRACLQCNRYRSYQNECH